MSDYKFGVIPDCYDERDYLYKATRTFTPYKLPDEVDLRADMPSMFSQNAQGSCTAQSGVCNYQYLVNRIRGDKTPYSRQFLYNMERLAEQGNLEEDSGATMRQICKTLKKDGVCTDNLFTYGNGNEFVEPNEKAKENAKLHRIKSYYRCLSITDIQIALVNKLPVLVGTEIYSSLWNTKENGIVPRPNKNKDEYQGGHAWLCVGYRTRRTLFGKKTEYILRTSWGKSVKDENSWGYAFNNPSDEGFGDNGYAYVDEKTLKDILMDAWVITEIED